MKTKETIIIEVTAEITYESDLGRESAIKNALQLNPSTVGCVVGGGCYDHEIKERKLISHKTKNSNIK